jgi:hypothetical protein
MFHFLYLIISSYSELKTKKIAKLPLGYFFFGKFEVNFAKKRA